MEAMMAEFRAAQQRRLVKRGIALWTASEAVLQAAVTIASPEPPKRTERRETAPDVEPASGAGSQSCSTTFTSDGFTLIVSP